MKFDFKKFFRNGGYAALISAVGIGSVGVLRETGGAVKPNMTLEERAVSSEVRLRELIRDFGKYTSELASANDGEYYHTLEYGGQKISLAVESRLAQEKQYDMLLVVSYSESRVLVFDRVQNGIRENVYSLKPGMGPDFALQNSALFNIQRALNVLKIGSGK